MEIRKINVRYETEIITQGKQIKPNGFSSLTFRNLGDDDVSILNNIPVKAHVSGDTYFDEFFLINRPDEVISHDISITFANVGTNPQILVIKTYYE